jgi:ppGpp synthetase/RelA/SpoT-type nucleotidyltranferase
MDESIPEKLAWVEKNLPLAGRLVAVTTELIRQDLSQRKIEFLTVSGRAKSLESAKEKLFRKSYTDLENQFTDLAGVRVISFLNSHVIQISEAIRSLFAVDENNSSDKNSALGGDRVGYRSIHVVCQLGPERNELPEYRSLGNLRFEVQIRTVLQHAWAELAHDRSFKLGQVLPLPLQRKLNLYSGMLELADLGFDEIATQLDDYASKLASSAPQILSTANIDSISLEAFASRISKNGIRLTSFDIDKISSEAISELNEFGLNNISDIEKLITDDFIAADKKHMSSNTLIGFLRNLMMFHDIDRYFERCHLRWAAIDLETLTMLNHRYGSSHVRSILRDYRIDIISDFE